MSTITEKLKWLVEADATSAIKGFEKAGAAAEKNLTKAQEHSQKLGGQLTKVGAGAMAASGVIGAALFKAAGSFEDLALASGKMADATGLSVEEASRWIEVAGDMGIGADVIQSSLGKMNKTLGATPAAFADLEIPIAKTADGLTDVNGTFLNTIARLQEIKDPAERAAAAAKIFGKGWQGAAELLKLSTDDIKTQLASVSDQKVINEDELGKAKDYRASLDSLKDSAEDLAIAIGQGAAPVLGGLAKGIATAVNLFGKLNAVTSGAAGEFAAFATIGLGTIGSMSFIAGQLIKMHTNLASIGPAASKAAGPLAVLGVVAVGLYERSKHAADGLADIAHNAEVLSKVSDANVLNVLNQSLATGFANGVSMAETMRLLAQTNLEGAKRAYEMADAQDHNGATTVALRRAIMDEMEAVKQAAVTHDEFGDSTEDTTTATEGLTIAQAAAKGATDKAAQATLEATKKSDAFADSLQQQRDKIDGLRSSARSAVDDQFAFRDATDEAKTKVDEMVDTLKHHKVTSDESKAAIDAAKDAALDASAKFATLNGAAIDSAGGIQRQIDSLIAQRDSLAPNSPLRLYLQEYIDALNAIPSNISTAMDLHISSGSVTTNQGDVIGKRAGPHAAGGRIPMSEGLSLVGEKGPELISAPGAMVSNASDTAAMRGGGGVTIQSLTINMPPGADGNAIVRELKKFERRNGPGWRAS